MRSLNRMNDLVDGAKHQGDIKIQEQSVFAPKLEAISLRKRVGMVFQESYGHPARAYVDSASRRRNRHQDGH